MATKSRIHGRTARELLCRRLPGVGSPRSDDLTENVAKLVLLCDKPLTASPLLEAMLENRNDPSEVLKDAIRMAEVTMDVRFTRLTPEESEEAIVDRLVEYSEEVGDHLRK